MDAIRAHVGAGGVVSVLTQTRSTVMEKKHFDKWDKAGTPLLKPEGEGYRMHTEGERGVYLLPDQLRYGVRQ